MNSSPTLVEVKANAPEVGEMKSKTWHGVDRSELDWFPTVNFDKCTGCGMCILTCGNDVFRWIESEAKPKIANPKKCMVGCTTCARVCPEQALTFPADPRVFVRGVVTKHKIFPVVRQELETRLQKFPSHVVHSSEVGTGPKGEKT